VTTYRDLVQDLMNEALSEQEIRVLCMDYYFPVFQQLSAGMSRTECVRRLVVYCYEQRQLEHLVEQVKILNVTSYNKYLPRLEQIEDKYPPESHFKPAVRPLDPFIVHPLPPAPKFVGREKELHALQKFWESADPGVLSLIGLGGAGKTAITAEFVENGLAAAAHSPDGLFVWSFYENQDVNQFLEAAYMYFSSGKTSQGSGAGTFYLLLRLLNKTTARYLIIMDGLERVQRPQGDLAGAFGDIVDPFLSQIVGRMATGIGQTKCIISTRFPLPGLDSQLGKSFHPLDVDQLQVTDARLLLRRHEIKGDDAVLDDLIAAFGAHALTLDHLGGYLTEYCDGDPNSAKTLAEPQIASYDLQERRLAKVLFAYEQALSDKELALLSRLCIFRFGTTASRLHAIFSTGDNLLITGPLRNLSLKNFKDMLKHLRHLHLALSGTGDEITAHPAIRDHFYRSFANPQLVHQAVRRHFISLVDAPGTGLPTHNESVDLLEELLYHTLQGGNVSEAEEIYTIRLGKYLHLAWNLGQYSRCVRILKEFPRLPDRAGLIWCYRALGDIDAALLYVDPDDTWWIGMLESLRGRFRVVADRLALNRRDPILAISQFMMGTISVDTLAQAPTWFGLPISPAECYLQAGLDHEAKSYSSNYLEQVSEKGSSWSDEIARYDLIQAELERRSGNYGKCRGLLEKATQWIIRSGSQEHLCLLHLGKARLAISREQYGLAETMISEGLHTAEQCGFNLYHIDLLNEQAKLNILTKRYDEAIQNTRAAVNGMLKSDRRPAPKPDMPENGLTILGASHPNCKYVWGEAKAGYLNGLSLFLDGKIDEAKRVLEWTLALQQQINHPDIPDTESLIKANVEEATKNLLAKP